MHQLTGRGARSHLDAGAQAARDPRGGKGVGLGSPGAGPRSQRGRQRVPSAPHSPCGAAGGCSPRRGCHPGEGPNGKLMARTPEIETLWEAPVPRGLGKRKMFRSRVRSRLLPSPERCPAVGQHHVPEKLLSPRLGTMAGRCHQAWETGTAGPRLVPVPKLVPRPMLLPNLVPKPSRLLRSTQEGSCHAETLPGCASLEDRGRGEAGYGVSSVSDPSRPRCRPQLESYIQSSVKPEMAQLQQTAVQNQTATMLEIGSSLLNQSAEQTRKLTDVEAQVGGSGRGHLACVSPCPCCPQDRPRGRFCAFF